MTENSRKSILCKVLIDEDNRIEVKFSRDKIVTTRIFLKILKCLRAGYRVYQKQLRKQERMKHND